MEKSLSVFCVLRDRLANVFLVPALFGSIPEAQRAYDDLIADKSTMIGKHPDDFELIHVADYDAHTGVIIPRDHVLVSHSMEVKNA